MLGNNLCKCAFIESALGEYLRSPDDGPDVSGRISQESSLVTNRKPLEKLFWNTISGCSTLPDIITQYQVSVCTGS